MKVKNRRRRQKALRFPVSFLIHRCRWGCNSSTSSRSSDVIRDSLLESLSQESSFQDTTDLLPDDNQSRRDTNSVNINTDRSAEYGNSPDAELLLGATSGGDDSDQENESALRMNPPNRTHQPTNPSPSPKDTTNISTSRPNRRRTLQEVFQIDIQRELQRQPLSEVTENRTHPLYNFNHNLFPTRQHTRDSLAVQVNPLFNLNDRLGRQNLYGPSSLIAQFMQGSQRSSEESDSSLRLGDADIDIFRSEGGANFDSLPRDLPDNQTSHSNVTNSSGSNASEIMDNSTTRTSLSSALADNYSAGLENVRFDFPHRMIALPTTGWLHSRLSRGLPLAQRPRSLMTNDRGLSENRTRPRSHNASSYEINPISPPNIDSLDTNSNNSNTGSRSSSQSSGSNRVPTQQNWYFYDSRLLPGNRQHRVMIESNFRGVNTQFDVPTILSPPAYDEIGDSNQMPNPEVSPSDPPPPYSDRLSDVGVSPGSTTYSNQSIEGEPPPAYEQSFHHQLGVFSNLPRESEPEDDNDIDSELSDSLSSSIQLDVDDDDIPSDQPCRAILDNFVLMAGSRQRQSQRPSGSSESNDPLSPSSNTDRPNSPFFLSPRSPNNTRPISPSPVTPDLAPGEDNNQYVTHQPDAPPPETDHRNPENDLEDHIEDATVREFFPPPITARSVFGGRPALRWSRNTTINRWMNTGQPWQL